MSQALARRHDYDRHQEAELARWPGVSWRREQRAKHYALILTFNGVSRFVTYPCTPGDGARGALNHIRDLRHALQALGARRRPEPKPGPDRRRRHHRVEPWSWRLPERGPPTRLSRDPFEALAQLRAAAWSRAAAMLQGGCPE